MLLSKHAVRLCRGCAPPADAGATQQPLACAHAPPLPLLMPLLLLLLLLPLLLLLLQGAVTRLTEVHSHAATPPQHNAQALNKRSTAWPQTRPRQMNDSRMALHDV